MNKKDVATEAQIVELLWPLVPTGEFDGAFDWLSGVMALDVSAETWKNIGEPKDKVEYEALRTYGHELFHFFQFTTMGFLYNWAGDLLDILRPIIKRVRSETDIHDRDFAGIKRLINEGTSLLVPNEAEDIEKHLMKIDAPSISGLTTRAIFESHAYFVERKLHYDIKDVTEWLPHIQNAPDKIYRVAFDFLVYTTGFAVAYEWFPLVASMSLCSNNPAETFEHFSLALRPDFEDDLSSNRGLTGEEMITFLTNRYPHYAWLTPNPIQDHRHPIFSSSASAFQEAESKGVFNRYELYAQPEVQMATLIKLTQIQIPIIFKPDQPSKIAAFSPTNFSKDSILALFTLGAIGRQLTKQAESNSQQLGNDAINQLSWLVNDHIPIEYTFADDDLRCGDPSRVIDLLGIKEEKDISKSKLWGRFYFAPSPEIERDKEKPLHTIPEAVRLTQAIQHEMPLFPIYFHRPFGQNWLALISPEEARVGELYNILHPKLVKLIEEANEAIRECGNLLNLNVWLLQECLFGDIIRMIENSQE